MRSVHCNRLGFSRQNLSNHRSNSKHSIKLTKSLIETNKSIINKPIINKSMKS